MRRIHLQRRCNADAADTEYQIADHDWALHSKALLMSTVSYMAFMCYSRRGSAARHRVIQDPVYANNTSLR